MKPEVFWGVIRDNLFRGKMTQGVVDTINVIVDTCLDNGLGKHHTAYVLATAYHESYHRKLNPDWDPVREGFANSNEGAIQAVTKLIDRGLIHINYALPHRNGKSYYGRGYVQITWPENYRRMGNVLGIPLYDDPDLALHRDVAALLLVIGMRDGLYTGKKLADYDRPDGFDAYNARRIINGLDKADKIRDHYEIFNHAIVCAANA